MLTLPENASYTGVRERVENGFITTFFVGNSMKVARIGFSDENLTRKHGAVTAYNTNGDVLFVSHYSRNRLNGTWNSWYENRVACDSGVLENDLPDGEWKTWYPDGQLRTIRHYSAVKYHGLSEEIRRNNNRATFFHLSAIYRKNRNAFNRYIAPEYSFSSIPGRELPSLPPGSPLKMIADLNTSNGNSFYLPPFNKCLHHGLYMNYFPSGAVKDSGYYKNGLREGVWMEMIEDENVRSIGYYRHGQKKDIWKYYNPEGKLLYIQHFNRHGQLVGAKEFVKAPSN
jgi:antitoxin component YwqK of YwqJK toxin-antitoxin module